MRTQKARYFVADFETTVYEGQTKTEVWAAAIVELYSEKVNIFGSIGDLFNYMVSLKQNIIVYFHNLKFDGAFWLYYLINDLHFQQAEYRPDEELALCKFEENRFMKSNTFKYSISKMGQWYTITIKVGKNYIELRDSLKLLPFSVKKLGNDFKTKHQKLSMKYEGYRYPNCPISESEKEYISNDVLVVKEAIEIMFEQGHKSLTIGACCLSEYKKSFFAYPNFDLWFPNLYEIPIDESLYDSPTAGDYIRRSYKGGWCYLVPEKANKIIKNGLTADVNSLYPSMMHSESGNLYPLKLPTFWKGNFIPEEALQSDKYYFLRVKTRFRVKKNYLPFIQIKNNVFYKSNLSLTTSDIYSYKDKKYHRYYRDVDGEIKIANVILTLTMTDWALIKEHYDLFDCEILDGCYFTAMKGIFDIYINKYKEIKLTSKGAIREIAKLFLNNLYGKLAMSKDSSFKYAYQKEDTSIGFYTIVEHDKKPGYIPCGSAITSYARNFTIRAAQANYYGPDNPGFIYADTDSIHCDLKVEDLKNVPIHDRNFCCWKIETLWDKALFVRQKAYVEHITHKDLQKVKNPYYNMKCAGMPEKSKLLFLSSIGDKQAKEELETFLQDSATELSEREIEFLSVKRTLKDFKIGLEVPGKLTPKTIPGGVVLLDTPYKMREGFRC